MDKKIYKKVRRSCCICGEKQYALLDVHRIHEGGHYNEYNCVVLCVSCHRRHHSGLIKIIQKFYSSGGWLLEYEDGGEVILKNIPS